MRALPVAAIVLFTAAAAAAQDAPRFCPNRPSLGESGCITEPGRVHLEVSAIDWTLDRIGSTREDTILAGDLQARFGLTPTAELQIAWTPYGHLRTRDRATGLIDKRARVGDVQIGVRQNLRNPDGSGLSLAIEPSVTLPVGRSPIGAGTWGVGVVLPVTYDLTKTVNLQLTNEIQAAPDADGDGRHFLLNEVAGVGYALSSSVTATAELQLIRDVDPADHATQLFAAGSLAWQPRQRLQLDILVGTGLNHDAPDLQIVTGGAILF